MNVNANIECATIVVTTEINTHVTLRPARSMIKPNSGLATADMIYTMELIVLASDGENSYFCMKNTLNGKHLKIDD